MQPVKTELRKVEAEVGPIKYIAALIYGDSTDQSLLENAVRIVILMIVSVFDPLAVLMLVAANWSLKHTRKEKDPEGWEQVWQPTSEAWPPYEPNFPDIDEIRTNSGVDQNLDMNSSLFETETAKDDEVNPVMKKVEEDYQEYLKHQEDPISKIIDQPIPKLDKFIGEYLKDEWEIKPPPQTIEKEVENLQQKSTINVNEIEHDPTNKMTFKHK